MNRPVLPAALVALAAFVWMVPLQLGWPWTYHQINPDITRYAVYAQAMADGKVPYRDFAIEYPPGAALIFVTARELPGSYNVAFSALMLVCLCTCVLGVVATARALGLSDVRQAVAGGVVALSPLLLGSLVQARFDMAVAAVIAWMLWAAVTGRWRTMWVLLGVGILVKLIPVALLPLLVIWHAHRRGWPAAIRGAVLCLAVVAVLAVPVALLSPSGTWYYLAYNLRRPPQLESMPATVFLVAHAVAGTSVSVVNNYGSFGLAGSGPRMLATLATVALVALVLTCAFRCWRLLERSHPTRDTQILIAGVAATMVALTVTGKVLSPQYMIWLLPVTVLVGGRYGWAATATMVVATVLTQLYFPILYFSLVAVHPGEVAMLALRNLSLIALLYFCWPRSALGDLPIRGTVIGGRSTAERTGRPPSAVPARHIVN